jgi:hypothetical protein
MAARKRPVGRPKLPRGEERESMLTLRLKPAERRELQKAAKAAGLTVSAWARRQLLGDA